MTQHKDPVSTRKASQEPPVGASAKARRTTSRRTTSRRTAAVASVVLAGLCIAWLAGCGAGEAGAGQQDFSGHSAAPTPLDVRNLQSNTQLSVPDPSFTAGSWSPGIIYDATGFDPGSQITIAVATFQSSSQFTQQTHAVYADSSGNLSSVWSPSDLPHAPAAGGYPKYQAFAYQDGTATKPAKVTNAVILTINS